MDYLTPIGIDGFGEAPNDARRDVARYISDLIRRADEHRRHLSMLVGSLLSMETSAIFKDLQCDIHDLIESHLRRQDDKATVRVLIWRSVDENGTIPLDDKFVALLQRYPSRFEVRLRSEVRAAQQASHFMLASPLRGDEPQILDGSVTPDKLDDGGWGLRIERPHDEKATCYAAWNSFAFLREHRSNDFMAVRDGYRLLGVFNSVWKEAVIIEPGIPA